jgi:hypothetical protein
MKIIEVNIEETICGTSCTATVTVLTNGVRKTETQEAATARKAIDGALQAICDQLCADLINQVKLETKATF